jgi:hypothetical protein
VLDAAGVAVGVGVGVGDGVCVGVRVGVRAGDGGGAGDLVRRGPDELGVGVRDGCGGDDVRVIDVPGNELPG